MVRAPTKKKAVRKSTVNRIASESDGNGDEKGVKLAITPPNFQTVKFVIEGISPYVQEKFSAKAKAEIQARQEAGPTARTKKQHKAKNFDECYKEAQHISTEGWHGIPAAAFRNGMISACKLVGYVMTRAKLAVFIEADGYDQEDASPLVKITKGMPRRVDSTVRIQDTVDIRARPTWDPGWQAELYVKYDADQFTLEDITNLLHRVGEQVGVGAGRNDSKKSNGMGWGCFKVLAG